MNVVAVARCVLMCVLLCVLLLCVFRAGHGALGHEVSSFLIQELPKFFLKQANLDSAPHDAISKAFVDWSVRRQACCGEDQVCAVVCTSRSTPARLCVCLFDCVFARSYSNVKLASSSIDCTFSGSTGIVVYLANGKIYSANAGDSRAVLAKASPNSASGEMKVTAVALSDDQKPEREDEKQRILANKGRVEACKGVKGEDIGPPRVCGSATRMCRDSQ